VNLVSNAFVQYVKPIEIGGVEDSVTNEVQS
jgi:hypothetical protein